LLRKKRLLNRVKAYRDEADDERAAKLPHATAAAAASLGSARAGQATVEADAASPREKPAKSKARPAYAEAASASPVPAKPKAAAQRPQPPVMAHGAPARKRSKNGRASEAAVRREARLDVQKREVLSYAPVLGPGQLCAPSVGWGRVSLFRAGAWVLLRSCFFCLCRFAGMSFLIHGIVTSGRHESGRCSTDCESIPA
jgi:hypothetical protein